MSDWTEKYRPRTLDGVVGNPSAVNTLRAWAKSWSSGVPEKRAVVLMGSPGIGKTTSAEALAREMGWDIVEMNASDQRSAEDIEKVALRGSMFDSFSDDGSFGSSSEGRRKLIILDEADNFFGKEDKGAIPAVNKLIRETRQPIILIVNDFYELSRKSPVIKNETLQITFKKASAATAAKVLRAIANSEGVDVDEEAMASIVANASGDMRAAIRNLQSLALGTDVVTPEMAKGISPRDTRKDMYGLMAAIFRSGDPSEARRAIYAVDADAKDVETWVDGNLPFEYLDRGDLVRGYEALCRADTFMGRVFRRQYYRFNAYASDMMSMGVSAAKMTDMQPRERLRFPAYLNKMSRSKAVRKTKADTVLKLAKCLHASTDRVSSDILPYLRIMLSQDPELRLWIVDAAHLEPVELAFVMGVASDSREVKSAFKEVAELSEERRISSQSPKPSVLRPSEPAVQKPPENIVVEEAPVVKEVAEKPSKGRRKAQKGDGEPAPLQSGQRSLFDFRGEAWTKPTRTS